MFTVFRGILKEISEKDDVSGEFFNFANQKTKIYETSEEAIFESMKIAKKILKGEFVGDSPFEGLNESQVRRSYKDLAEIYLIL